MRLPFSLLLLTALLGALVAPDKTLALNRLAVYAAGGLVFVLAAWGGATRSRQMGIASRRKDAPGEAEDRDGGSPLLSRGAVLILLGGVAAAVLSLLVTDWAAGELLPGLPLAGRFPLILRLPGSGVPNPANGANPRMVAGAMALFLPLAFSLALFARRPALRLLGGLAGLTLLFPLYLSQSPQGLLALAAGMGLALALRFPWSLIPQLGLALLAALAWRLWQWGLPPELIQRLGAGVQSRLEIWPVALLMLRDMPFSGGGLNNFPVLQPLYNSSLAIQPHAHSVFLQTALDLGLLGLAACLGLFTLAFRTAWRAQRQSPDPDVRAALAGCAGGCAAFLGYGLWDSMTLGSVPALAVWAMLGLLCAAGQLYPAPPGSGVRLRRWRLVPLAGLGAAALLAAPVWAGALLVNAGRILYHPLVLQVSPLDAPAETSTQAALPPGDPRLKRALWLGQAAARLYPLNGRAFLLQGLAAISTGQDRLAVPALERGLALEPCDARLRLELADACDRLGQAACAAYHWRLAGAYDLLIGRGIEAHARADYGQAARWFSLAIQVDPAQSPAWLRLGRAYNAAGEAQQAQAAFEEVIWRFPSLSAGYEDLAGLLLQQPALAALVLEQGLQNAQPPGAQLYYLRSRLAAGRKEYAAAEQDARQALAMQPGNGVYLAWLGDIYLRQQRYAEALAQYERMAALPGAADWAWRANQRIGHLYAAQGLWSQAAAAYTQSILLSQAQAVKPSALAQSYAALGDVLARSGDLPGAENAYRRALQLDAENLAAQDGLQELQAR